MLFQVDEQVFRFECPMVHEAMFTSSEIEELFSLINQPDDPSSPGSGSQESNRTVYSTQERKMRRMQSNRESARRSRWRKKRHLENLTNQLNRLKIENRALKNRLASTVNHHLLLSMENECLISESMTLMAKLSDPCQISSTMFSQ